MNETLFTNDLYEELAETWDQLTDVILMLSLRYPSHLVRRSFTLDESEEKVWIVVVPLPGNNDVAWPIPDDQLYKFRHLNEVWETEHNFDPETITKRTERLIAFGKR